jgi:long-chain acyl-CoA synthetase
MSQNALPDTIPKLFVEQYRKFGDDKTAVSQKDLGIWQSYTWKHQYEVVKYFSLGIISLGLKPGDTVSIVGDSDRHWYWTRWAVLAAGGIVAGMYADSIPSELKYVAEDSDSKFVVADDQEQVDKMLEIKDELPLLEKVIYWDPKGLRNYDDPILISYARVMEIGREYEREHPDAFTDNIAVVKPDDTAYLVYTSGTSAAPKGAILSHRCIMAGCAGYLRAEPAYENDRFFAPPTPAWIAGPLWSLMALMSGAVMFYPEEPDTLQEDTREIAPEMVLYGARFWESIASTVLAKMTDASKLKRLMYFLFQPVGYKVAYLRMDNITPGLFWKSLYRVADWLVFRPLRDKFGLIRTRVGITAGAMTSPDTFVFFNAIGIRLKQSYGLTEVIPITHHRDGEIRFESVGPPVMGSEVRISDEGEILVRAPNVFGGYHKLPEKSAEIIENGWLRTGDAGHIAEDGHIIYLDRVAELRELAGGDKYAPQFIESRMRFSPYIKDVITLGGKNRDFVGALINIDPESCSRWAEANKVIYTTFADLSQKDEILELVKKDVKRVNRDLPDYSKIRKFANLYKELDPDEAELTRTKKLRRGFLEERYHDLIEAVYRDAPEYIAETTITYRDGRQATMKTAVKIGSLEGEN